MTLYTLSELSQLLKMSESYLYKATQRGILPALHVGRSLRYDDDCINAFLQKCRESKKQFPGRKNNGNK